MSRAALAFRRHALLWREPAHPFVQQQLPAPPDGSTIFRSPSAGALHALVADHVVQGRVIFPGAGYLETARATCCFLKGTRPREGATLHNIFFMQVSAAK